MTLNDLKHSVFSMTEQELHQLVAQIRLARRSRPAAEKREKKKKQEDDQATLTSLLKNTSPEDIQALLGELGLSD